MVLGRLGWEVCRIDGDELRQSVCRDLGFSRADRAENVRRAGNFAVKAAQAGQAAIVSLISPYAVDRSDVRRLHEDAQLLFVEVFVDCPVSVAEARDPKGLYRRARAGQFVGLTGVDAPYEAPAAPDVALDTSTLTLDQETDLLTLYLLPRLPAALPESD